MKRSRYSDEQNAYALRQAESGTALRATQDPDYQFHDHAHIVTRCGRI